MLASLNHYFDFAGLYECKVKQIKTTTPGLLPRGKGTFKRRVLSPHKSRAGIAERPPLLNNPDHLQYRNPDQRTGMYYRPSGAKRRGRSKLQRQEPANFHSP